MPQCRYASTHYQRKPQLEMSVSFNGATKQHNRSPTTLLGNLAGTSSAPASTTKNGNNIGKGFTTPDPTPAPNASPTPAPTPAPTPSLSTPGGDETREMFPATPAPNPTNYLQGDGPGE
jgi:hypothetical protein